MREMERFIAATPGLIQYPAINSFAELFGF